MIFPRFFLSDAGSPRRWLLPVELSGIRIAAERAWNWRRLLAGTGLLPLCLAMTSCPAMDGRQLSGVSRTTVVPAKVLADFFLVEARIAGMPYRFLLDSGSSISLISPQLAMRHAGQSRADESVSVRTAAGDEVELPTVTLPHLALGRAGFARVPAAVYDFEGLSQQLGVRVDGVLGFRLFRDVLLTVDYPQGRLVLAPRSELTEGDGELIRLFDAGGMPMAAMEVGGVPVMALIDTGSDGGLSLNFEQRVGAFLTAPRPGPLRATLAGDRPQVVGRLAGDLRLGSHRVTQPVVDFTEGLPTLGGEVLKHFALTFDQKGNAVAIRRSSPDPVQVAARRSIGLSFLRESDGWHVAGVVPGTPAAELPVETGDVCVGVNGEPTADWPLERFYALLRVSPVVTLTLNRNGALADLQMPVVDLVP